MADTITVTFTSEEFALISVLSCIAYIKLGIKGKDNDSLLNDSLTLLAEVLIKSPETAESLAVLMANAAKNSLQE